MRRPSRPRRALARRFVAAARDRLVRLEPLSETSRSLWAVGAVIIYASLNRFYGWTEPDFLLLYNLFAAIYLPLTWLFMARQAPSQIAVWAGTLQTRPDWQKRLGSEASAAFIVIVSATGLISALVLRLTEGEQRGVEAAGVVLAWLLLHTAYTLLYARLYYTGMRGLRFSGEDEPAFSDFAYFAFTLGTSLATSDVEVTSRNLRQTVLTHTLLAFLYNTVLLALVLEFVVVRG